MFENVLVTSQLDRLYKAVVQEGEMYAVGGIDARTISKFNERYDIEDDTWVDAASMPTPRFLSQSAFVDGKIFVFGGISVPATSRELSVTPNFEAYDPLEDEWEILSPMPTVNDGTAIGRLYALSMATSQVVRIGGRDKVIFLGGVTEVAASGEPSAFSDRVLIYDVASDSWETSDAFGANDYLRTSRIAPMSFLDGDEVVVVGGTRLQIESDPLSPLEFHQDSFAYNFLTGGLRVNDGDFSTLPTPRFRGASVSNLRDHYFLAGTSERSQSTRFLERVDSSQGPFDYERLDDIPSP